MLGVRGVVLAAFGVMGVRGVVLAAFGVMGVRGVRGDLARRGALGLLAMLFLRHESSFGLRTQNFRLSILFGLLHIPVLGVEGEQQRSIGLAERREDCADLALAETLEELPNSQLPRHHLGGVDAWGAECAMQLRERDLVGARKTAEN